MSKFGRIFIDCSRVNHAYQWNREINNCSFGHTVSFLFDCSLFYQLLSWDIFTIFFFLAAEMLDFDWRGPSFATIHDFRYGGYNPFWSRLWAASPQLTRFPSGEIRGAGGGYIEMFSRWNSIPLMVYLERGQQRMVEEANKHMCHTQFATRDRVFLKFRPYRQILLFAGKSVKLAPHYFGPFVVEEWLGAMAYVFSYLPSLA